jgi:hypothetical protein
VASTARKLTWPLLAFLAAAVLLSLRTRARSLAARWRGTGARHARPPVPPHPRPSIGGPGTGQPDVPLVLAPLPLPWPSTMPKRPAETVIDEAWLAPIARPYVGQQREGSRVA